MGTLFIPPLKVNRAHFDFKKKKVRRFYFQFYFENSDGRDKFKIRAYAIGKKRKPLDDCPPIEFQLAEIKPGEENRYLFPKESNEIVLGHLELSDIQIKKILKNVKSEYLQFTPREVKINPFCLVYDVVDASMRSIESANPCPPARPPADSAGNT